MTLRLDPLIGGCGLALMVRYPWLAAALGVPLLTKRFRAVRLRRDQQRRAQLDPMVVGRVIQIGLAGGLPLMACLTLAISEVGQLVAGELTVVMRTARREGLSASLAGSASPLLRPLFSRVALAQSSGAPMHDAVSAYLADGRAAQRGKVLEQVRRLPVALMVPLGLLILPGFVVLFVGPIVLTSLQDLSRSLP